MRLKRVVGQLIAAFVFLGVAISAAAGCGGSNPNGGFTNGGSGGGNGDDSGTLLGGGGASGGLGGDGGGGSNLLDSGCATATAATQRSPVYMLVVLDGSGSMQSDNKWTGVVPALDAFFDDLLSKADPSFAVGLIAFSDQNDPTCSISFFSAGCSGPYPTNIDVRIAAVDAAQHAKLRGRIDPSSPMGDTPTHTALQGGFSELENFKPSGTIPPNGKKVLVLMTDGVPTDGSNTASNSALVAQELGKGITTFAVGIGPFPSTNTKGYDPVFMGHIAKAGGAAPTSCNQNETQNVANVCHLQVTPGGKSAQQVEQDFINAINAIRGQVATCEFVLEKSSGAVDPSQVNVIYTDQNGTQHVLVQDGTNGWTYDDPNNPTKVILHGGDCDEVKNDPKGKISIVLGCKTVTK
jgi:Mg-chelatase subunit ChlD